MATAPIDQCKSSAYHSTTKTKFLPSTHLIPFDHFYDIPFLFFTKISECNPSLCCSLLRALQPRSTVTFFLRYVHVYVSNDVILSRRELTTSTVPKYDIHKCHFAKSSRRQRRSNQPDFTAILSITMGEWCSRLGRCTQQGRGFRQAVDTRGEGQFDYRNRMGA